MAGTRFDLFDAARLESRQGGIGTGALVRNGFVEVDAEKERWSWQRPALQSSAEAPFSGKALGMLDFEGVLYGIQQGTGGTATSWNISLKTGTTTPLFLVAEMSGVNLGYIRGGWGTLVPSTWSGGTVSELKSFAVTHLEILGTWSQSLFTRFSIGTNTVYTALATYAVGPGFTAWEWPNILFTTAGTYTGAFR